MGKMPIRLAQALAFLVALSIGHVQAADLNQSSWSEVDGSNNATPPNGWPAGMQPNQVEPTARAMMGATKRFYDHNNATVTSAGTANAQTLTYPMAPQALVAGDVYRFFVGPGLTNTAAMTIDVNGLGAKAVVTGSGAALTGGEIVAGTIVEAVYDGTNFRITNTGNTIHGSALVADGSLTVLGGSIFLDNNQAVWFRTSGGAYASGIFVTPTNDLTVGSSNFTGNIRFFNNGAQHATIDTTGTLTLTGGLTATNAIVTGGNYGADNLHWYGVKNTSGTYVPLVSIDGSNNYQAGSTALSGQLQFWNNGSESGYFDTSHQLNLNNNLAVNRNIVYLAASGDANHAIYNQSSSDGEVFSFHNSFNAMQNNATSRLFISTSGLVGIGKTNPAQLLDVGGNINASGSYLVNGAALACGNLSNAALSCTIDATNASNITGGTLPSGRLTGNYFGITGVGQGAGLTVNGNAINYGLSSRGSTGYDGSTGMVLFNAVSNAFFDAKDDGSVVAVEGNGTLCAFTGGAGWGCSSDANLKNVKPLKPEDIVPGLPVGQSMMKQIAKLAPIEYTLNNDRFQKTHTGFTAQSLMPVFPHLVSTASNGTLLVEYTEMIAPLVQAVQELNARVSALEAKVP